MTTISLPNPLSTDREIRMSHSRWNGYTRCPNQFRLRKGGYPTKPAWYLLAGRTFHSCCDDVDYALWLNNVLSADDIASSWAKYWAVEYAEAKAQEPDESLWVTAGRRTKDKPNKEDGIWWNATGPTMVEGYIAARLAEREVGFDTWELPDGNPAIEVPIEIELTNGLTVRGAIDRVMVTELGNPSDGVLIRDLKTSQREPEDAAQLGIYKVALEDLFGVKVFWGDHFMARTGKASDPVSLSHYTADLFIAEYGAVQQMMALGFYPATPGDACRVCDVKKACAIKGGTEAEAWRFAMPY